LANHAGVDSPPKCKSGGSQRHVKNVIKKKPETKISCQRGKTMDTQSYKYKQMQDKLKNGLANLKNVSPDDSTGIGAVLAQLHGALEDYVRLAVAEKALYLRDQVEDKRKVKWNDLLTYGRTYLGFTDADCNIIDEANRQRNNFAHGDPHTYTYEKLKSYARFVEKWCEGTGVSTARESSKAPKIETYARRPEPAPEPVYEPVYTYSPTKPWYRSTPFLLFAFIFLGPVWALLMITDREQGCFVKSFAYAILLSLCFFTIGLARYGGILADIFGPALAPNSASTPPPAIISPSAAQSPITVPVTDASLPSTPETMGTCQMIWVEYTSGDLGGKSRATVWEEIVADQVRGSGMTPRDFYNLVVEHNPALIADGYEFKRGKTYLLPECQ
jgi:hypothetical protein